MQDRGDEAKSNINQASLLKFESASHDDDVLLFAPEKPKAFQEGTWKILLVDDDPSVHQATKVALRFFSFEDQALEFLSSYSVTETLEILALNPDIALILLDVVMETPDAGLKIAQHIRETQGNQTVRIILRTGQPGQVPEETVVLNYDINDYKTKLELTQEKLFTTVVAALRAYRDLVALEENRKALAQANAKLVTFNKGLETLVERRTNELSKTNQQLTQEIEERQKAEMALRIYVNALTHDLRNPVTGLVQVLQSLRRRESLESVSPPSILVTQSILERMGNGCDRLLKMIEQLLDAEASSIQGVILHCQTLSLPDLIASLLNEWRFAFEKKRIIIDANLPNDLPSLWGDYHQLWRVLENIIANAVKYNPPGLTILINAEVFPINPSLLHITIIDDGIGIDPIQCKSIFNIYQRGGQGTSIRGLGIGLYICRQIVEAHGGEIGVISQLQQGTTFWLTLPIQQDS